MSHFLKTSNPDAAAAISGDWQSGAVPLAADDLTEEDLERVRQEGPGPIIERHVDLDVLGEQPELPPLPGVANMVVYHLRDGDARNRRTHFPAIVMAVDAERRELMLWVIVDDGDTWMQERVPAHAAPEAGWERVARDALVEIPAGMFQEVHAAIDSLRARVEEGIALVTLANNVSKLPPDVHARLLAIEGRLVAIEAHPALEIPALPTAADVEAMTGATAQARGVPGGQTATTSRKRNRRG